MMRAAEGTRRDQRAAVEQAHHGMHLGGFDCLLESHRGQNRRQPLGEHRLARSRRPDHQDVVTAGRRDLERALGLLLAFDLAEIDVVDVRVAERSGEIDRNRLQRTQALEEFESFAQTLDSEHCGALANNRGLGRILARQYHPGRTSRIARAARSAALP